jgi:hypothetical protein
MPDYAETEALARTAGPEAASQAAAVGERPVRTEYEALTPARATATGDRQKPPPRTRRPA